MQHHFKYMDLLKKPALALAVSSLAFSANHAWAQDVQDDGATTPSPAEEPQRLAPRTQIDTIATFAQKTEGDVQTTPVAQTVISGEALRRQFAQDFRDVTGAAPNVLLEPVGAFQNASAFFIRGAGSADIESAADPGIAVIIDGVYQARTSTALSDFLDVEAVEVLRGPQGTLFGRNAIGGAVLLRHNAPDVDEFGLSGSILAGQYGRLDVKGIINVPIVEGKAAFRLAVKSTNFDGFYTNAFNGEDYGTQDRITILPSVRFENENLDVTIRGEYARIRDGSNPNVPHNACRVDPATQGPPSGPIGPDGQPTPLPGELFFGDNDAVVDSINLFLGPERAAQFCAQPVGKGDFTIDHDDFNGEGADFDIWGITGEVNYDMPDVGTITYIGNYRDVDEDVWNDFDTTPLNLFETRRIQRHWQTSHELRFASDFSDFVQFVVGAYYFEQHYVLEQNLFGTLGGATNPFGPVDSLAFGRSEQSHNQWALFGQAYWTITDDLTLITGIRYTEEEKNFLHCGVGFGDVATRECFPNVPGIDDRTFDSRTDIGEPPMFAPGTNQWSNVSPKIGLEYQFTDDIFTFASWTRGFRSGGFNGRGNTPSTAGPFDEEKANSYEIGIKMDLLDDRLRLNIAAFWTTFSNLQRTIIRPAAGSGGQETVTENAAKARSRGIEAELTAVVAEGFTVNGSIGYLDAQTLEWCADLNGPLAPTPPGKEVCGDVTVIPNGGGELIPFDNAGLEILRAPKWTTRLNLVYEMPIGNSGFLTFSGEWLYRSSMNLVSAGFPPGTTDGVLNYDGTLVGARRPSAHIFNANVTWEDIESRYRVSFFMKNITNEIYQQSGTYVAGLFNFRQPNEPRHWGIEVSFDL